MLPAKCAGTCRKAVSAPKEQYAAAVTGQERYPGRTTTVIKSIHSRKEDCAATRRRGWLNAKVVPRDIWSQKRIHNQKKLTQRRSQKYQNPPHFSEATFEISSLFSGKHVDLCTNSVISLQILRRILVWKVTCQFATIVSRLIRRWNLYHNWMIGRMGYAPREVCRDLPKSSERTKGAIRRSSDGAGTASGKNDSSHQTNS